MSGLLVLATCAPQSPYEPPSRGGGCSITDGIPVRPIILGGDDSEWQPEEACINDMPTDDASPASTNIETTCVARNPDGSELYFKIWTAGSISAPPNPLIRLSFHVDDVAKRDGIQQPFGICAVWDDSITMWSTGNYCGSDLQGPLGPEFVAVNGRLVEFRMPIDSNFPTGNVDLRGRIEQAEEPYDTLDEAPPIDCGQQ